MFGADVVGHVTFPEESLYPPQHKSFMDEGRNEAKTDDVVGDGWLVCPQGAR